MRKTLNEYYAADDGCIFVCTEAGYNRTPDAAKHERTVGKPVPLFDSKVPASWVEKGWVVERKA